MPGVGRDQRRAAFEQFVAESTGSLLRTAYLITGDAGHAEDLVQESFFKVARRWSRVASMENPRAYARRILLNLALDNSKRRSRHRAELASQNFPDLLGSGPRGSEIGADPATDDRDELVRALGELPPRQRAVLVLRYFDDLSESEAASTLGCSVGTVKSSTSRALEKMRHLVPQTIRWDEPTDDAQLCSIRKGERR
jgi:RNA polymerase sigma-70 factor (sigma-E family)